MATPNQQYREGMLANLAFKLQDKATLGGYDFKMPTQDDIRGLFV